jgi:predicted metal-dependent hydrolase
MQRVLLAKEKKIKYKLNKSKRAKNLRISVNGGGEVTVTKPWFLPHFFVDNFLKEKQDWILDKIKKRSDRKDNTLRVPRRHRQAYLKHKEQARELINEAIEKYNPVYNFKYNQVRIKNQKTRWGSCSENGNLNFSYRLVHMPKRMAEYIVVHELCHLGQLNHSKKFWQLVEMTFPDYKVIEKQLKKV